MNASAYPLSWPRNWPRRPVRLQSAFGDRSIDKATQALLQQLKTTGARDIIVSTNLVLRIDGLPKSGQSTPADPAVAVYFHFKDKPRVLACDKWNRVQDNLWAIAKDVEALRGRERWGVGTIEQAFAGYTALPAPGDRELEPWYTILAVAVTCTFDEAQTAYRYRAGELHPDKPRGSHEAMSQLNRAWAQAKLHFGR